MGQDQVEVISMSRSGALYHEDGSNSAGEDRTSSGPSMAEPSRQDGDNDDAEEHLTEEKKEQFRMLFNKEAFGIKNDGTKIDTGQAPETVKRSPQLTQAQYDEIIHLVESYQSARTKKERAAIARTNGNIYKYSKRFTVKTKLVEGKEVKQLHRFEEELSGFKQEKIEELACRPTRIMTSHLGVFDAIYNVHFPDHSTVSHTHRELLQTHANITAKNVWHFVNLCPICNTTRPKPKPKRVQTKIQKAKSDTELTVESLEQYISELKKCCNNKRSAPGSPGMRLGRDLEAENQRLRKKNRILMQALQKIVKLSSDGR